MAVRVGGILFVIDGAEIQILTEGGSAKEAYEVLLHEAEEIGGSIVPHDGVASGDKPKSSRNRRTKAEMDAARAAAADSGNAAPPREPTPGLPGPAAPPAQPAPMSAFAPVPGSAQGIPPGAESMLPPGTASVLPPNPPAAPVGFTSDPRAPQDGKTVGFDGPPPPGAPPAPPASPAPPMLSEEDVLRQQVDAVVERTIAMQPAWADNVRQAYVKSLNGEQFGVMRADRIREVLRAVEDYERRVKEALGR